MEPVIAPAATEEKPEEEGEKADTEVSKLIFDAWGHRKDILNILGLKISFPKRNAITPWK